MFEPKTLKLVKELPENGGQPTIKVLTNLRHSRIDDNYNLRNRKTLETIFTQLYRRMINNDFITEQEIEDSKINIFPDQTINQKKLVKLTAEDFKDLVVLKRNRDKNTPLPKIERIIEVISNQIIHYLFIYWYRDFDSFMCIAPIKSIYETKDSIYLEFLDIDWNPKFRLKYLSDR